MRISRLVCLTITSACGTLVLATPPQTPSKTETLRGWLSDEQCSKGRAQVGTYTATNPDCAKECVKKGKQIVLIDPVGKRILVLTNQDVGKKNIGDYVEIAGEIDSKAMTIHADSLKFLEKGSVMCEAPPKKKLGL
jgi:hypothetical protein